MKKTVPILLLCVFAGCEEEEGPCGCEKERSAAIAKHGEPDRISTYDGSGWEEGHHWVNYHWAITDSTAREMEFYWGSGDGSDICCDITHVMCADGVCYEVGRIRIDPGDSYLVR